MRRHESSTRSRSIRPRLPRFGRHALLVLATALVAVAAAGDSIAQPTCTITWDGGAATNSWHDAANWTGDALPGPTDHVCIPASVTVEVSQDAGSVLTVQSQGTLSITGGSLTLTDTTESSVTATLTQSGGTLAGTGTLTVNGAFNWSGGTHIDAGTTVIASTATLTIDAPGGAVGVRGGRTFQNNGTATWTSGDIYIDQNGRLENAGTLDATGDNVVTGFFDLTTGLIHNTGTFRKSGGTATTTIFIPFDNDGTVEASAGTLSLEGNDGGSTTGDFAGSGTDGLIRFASNFTLESGVTLGDRVTLAAGTLTVSGDVSVPAGATFTQSGGNSGIAGTGTLTVNGAFNWSGGTHIDAGTTVIASTATLTIDAPGGAVGVRGGRTFQNNGTATWTSGDIYIDQNGRLENAGTLDATGDNVVTGFFDLTTGLIHNTGTFRKSGGTATTTIFIPFDNDGTVEASAGTLSLEGNDGGSTTGDFAGSGTDGLIRFASNFTLESGVTLGDRVTLAAGTLTVSGDVSVPAGATFTQSGGNSGIAGTGTLTVNGAFNWSGGTHIDAGTTVIASTATLTIDAPGGAVGVRGGRTFQNNGTATWTSGDIYIDQNGRLENAGTLDATGDNVVTGFFDLTTGLIHNTGTFRKSGGTATTAIFIPFDNDGTVEASAGTLSLEGNDGGSTTGDFAGSGTDGLIRFASNFTLESGVTLGDRVTLAAGTLTVSGDVSVPAGRTFTQSGGNSRGRRHRHAHRQRRLQLERRHPYRRRHHGDRLDRHAHDRCARRSGRRARRAHVPKQRHGDLDKRRHLHRPKRQARERRHLRRHRRQRRDGVLRPHDRADPQHRHLQKERRHRHHRDLHPVRQRRHARNRDRDRAYRLLRPVGDRHTGEPDRRSPARSSGRRGSSASRRRAGRWRLRGAGHA